MAFRDERDALIAQRDALEAELRDVRARAEQAEGEVVAHQAKDRDAGKEIVALRREVAALRAKLGETAPPSQRRALVMAGVALSAVLVVTIAGIVAALVVLRGDDEAPQSDAAHTGARRPFHLPVPPVPDDRFDAQAMNMVVAQNRPQLRRCYEDAIRGHRDPPVVRVTVLLEVAATGEVSDTSVTVDGSSDELGSCVASVVRGWRFPPRGTPTVTEFPVIFAPG